MIKNVLFDLGGVLIDLDVKRSVQAFIALMEHSGNSETPITAMDLIGGGETELMQLYQTGEISTDEFVTRILSVCRRGTTREQVLDAWFAMLLSLPQHRIEMIRRLKEAGLHVYILSNINEAHVEWTLRHFAEWGIEIGREIDRAFFSNEIHMAKPNPRCFELVIREAGIQAEETLYIDDLEQNIQAGAAAGFVTLQAVGDEWLPAAEEIINKAPK